MIPLEIVINARSTAAVDAAARAAADGGAARIELCANMEQAGLSPKPAHIRAARRAFGDRPGLMVMVRPHAVRGAREFVYDSAVIDRMCAEINVAADCGANGVVLGALRARDGCVHLTAMRALVGAAQARQLQVTFHRAFDATPNPLGTIDALIELRVDHALTSGTPWGARGTALDGLLMLQRTIKHAANRMEVIVCGGVSAARAPELLAQLPGNARISLHAYSSVLVDGMTDAQMVRELVGCIAPPARNHGHAGSRVGARYTLEKQWAHPKVA